MRKSILSEIDAAAVEVVENVTNIDDGKLEEIYIIHTETCVNMFNFNFNPIPL